MAPLLAMPIILACAAALAPAPPGLPESSASLSPEDAALRERMERERIEQCFELIQEFNHPHAWTDLGGSELSLHHIGGEWVVEMHPAAETSGGGPSPRAMKEEVEAFIRRYRPILDGRPPEPPEPPEEVLAAVPMGFRDTPENERTREQMRARRITVNFTDEPLLRALLEIERQAGLDIEPDWKALADTGATPETPLSLRAIDEPLVEVLERTCETVSDEFDPARITIERGRIILTSASNARRHATTAVYDLREMLEQYRKAERHEDVWGRAHDDEIIEAWLDVLVESIDPHHWHILGGDTGLAHFIDAWLFIHNTPDVHRRIERMTDAMLAAMRSGERIVNVGRDPFRRNPATEMRIYDLRDVLRTQHRTEPPDFPIEAFFWHIWDIQSWVDTLVEFIDPDEWRMMGGDTGSIHIFSRWMIVQHTPEVHHRIERLTNALCTVARGEARIANLGRDPFTRGEIAVEIRLYDIVDLIHAMRRGDGEIATWDDKAAKAIDEIMESIDAESWRNLGGDVGMIHEYGGIFIIATTAENHAAIETHLRRRIEHTPSN